MSKDRATLPLLTSFAWFVISKTDLSAGDPVISKHSFGQPSTRITGLPVL